MDVELKTECFQDKDNLVLALTNSGYTVSTKHIERKLWDVPKGHWLVSIHDFPFQSDLHAQYTEYRTHCGGLAMLPSTLAIQNNIHCPRCGKDTSLSEWKWIGGARPAGMKFDVDPVME